MVLHFFQNVNTSLKLSQLHEAQGHPFSGGDGCEFLGVENEASALVKLCFFFKRFFPACFFFKML